MCLSAAHPSTAQHFINFWYQVWIGAILLIFGAILLIFGATIWIGANLLIFGAILLIFGAILLIFEATVILSIIHPPFLDNKWSFFISWSMMPFII